MRLVGVDKCAKREELLGMRRRGAECVRAGGEGTNGRWRAGGRGCRLGSGGMH